MSQPRSPRRERLNGRIAHEDARSCAVPGCPALGEFRAPQDNRGSAPGEWRWLCLEHVRAFNSSYNYFDGMSPEEIARAHSPHPSWERATRAFASNGYADRLNFADPLNLAGARFGTRATEGPPPRGARPVHPADARALSVLGLGQGATPEDIRRRYKQLVRRYHPDMNGGDRRSEGRLQDVIAAYTHLKNSAAQAASAPQSA